MHKTTHRLKYDPLRARSRFLAPVLALVAALALASCGGGSSTPPVAVAVAVSPASGSVQSGSTKQFQATVTGTSNTAVTWSIDGVAGGNATAGTISAAGMYTAPSLTGSHTVTATSAADTSKYGSAGITVAADIKIDFNGRSGGAVIPAGLFGSSLVGLSASNPSTLPEMQTLVSAGMSGTRFYANVPTVFATATPNWTFIDSYLDIAQQAGMKVTLMLAYTPARLQPASLPCSAIPNATGVNAAPDPSAYASIAAQYVAHIDSKYKGLGLVEYYEIWNEPDSASQYCGLTPADSTNSQARLDDYTALYTAVATAMKAQAATDGVSINVGGPALSNYVQSSAWITQLLTLAKSGTPLDFVSYHQYPSGSDVSSTMTWDGANGTASLYRRTIDPNSGYGAVYQNLAKSIATAGLTTPVLMDEYSDDSAFSNDCCKNSPTYAPVWNMMVFSQVMNSVYNGAQPIQRMSYYAASNAPFCLLGDTVDIPFACGTTGPQNPYPQFRAYELLASPNFLGLQASGGNLAKSVSNASGMKSAGLVTSAFYTQGAQGTPALDAVVLVNPLATAITNAVLEVGNPGLSNPTATQYLLNASTYSPTTPVTGTALPLITNGTSVQFTVTLPPYSVLAIKIAAQ